MNAGELTPSVLNRHSLTEVRGGAAKPVRHRPEVGA